MKNQNFNEEQMFLKNPMLPLVGANAKYIDEVLIKNKLFFKCRISILVVTDASGSFDTTASFGLGHFLKVFNNDPNNIATDNPASYVSFTVKTAHRGNTTSDFPNFKFDTHNLNQYDQIWLFGVARQSIQLSENELLAISNFMNSGGGIFATGDHEDLGVDLCGKLPRVRTMRRWWFTQNDPFGSPKAPPQSFIGGTWNHNTINDNPATLANEKLIFGNQSDNFPQTIFPRYRRVFTGNFLKRRIMPHPVLCGPNGVIKVLPDHMHEGKCDIYNDFGRTLTFAGSSFQEFPNKTGSTSQQLPEVIADNINLHDNTKFESISVYDGHKTDNAGRILCDATWHHFFNINLIGFENSRTRVRAGIGDAEDNRSEAAYNDIRAYFRNIAYWISRKSDQKCMKNKGFHLFVHNFDFLMTYRPAKLIEDKFSYYLFIGELAKDSLNQYAPQCQSYEWIISLLQETPIKAKFFESRADEEKIRGFESLYKWIDTERVLTLLLGKSMHDLYEFLEEKRDFSEDLYKEFDYVLLKGKNDIYNLIIDDIAKELKVLQKDLK